MTLTNTISQYVLAKLCRLLVGVVWSRMPDQSTNFLALVCLSSVLVAIQALRTYFRVRERRKKNDANEFPKLALAPSLSHSCQESPRREKIHENIIGLKLLHSTCWCSTTTNDCTVATIRNISVFFDSVIRSQLNPSIQIIYSLSLSIYIYTGNNNALVSFSLHKFCCCIVAA